MFSYTCKIIALYAIKYNTYVVNPATISELLLRDQMLKDVPLIRLPIAHLYFEKFWKL